MLVYARQMGVPFGGDDGHIDQRQTGVPYGGDDGDISVSPMFHLTVM